MIGDNVTPNHVEWDEERQVRRSYYEIEDGVIAIKTEYFVEQILDDAAVARAEAPRRWGDGFVRVASIPMNLWMRDYSEAHSLGDEKYVKKLLNDSDMSRFRTRDGRV